MDLVVLVYQITEHFPKNEIYGLTSQMRRAAVSIPSNIAEGSRRSSKKDFRNFLMIAYGSGAELETQLKISLRLGFISTQEFDILNGVSIEIMKMLNSFITKLDK